MKPTNSINDQLIHRTIETWQPHFGNPLSREDARQIIENISGFFSVLAEWSRAEARTTLSAADAPDSTTEHGEVRDVMVLADGDDPGEAAARDCALRCRCEGRRVRKEPVS